MGGGASTRSGVDAAQKAEKPCRGLVGLDYDGPMLLTADVGGTSSRLHLFLPPTDMSDTDSLVPPERRVHEAKYSNSKFESFLDVCRAFLLDAGMKRPPEMACFAVAGVVVEGRCSFVNLGWVIDAEKIRDALGISKVVLINDFAAQGYGILTLDLEKDCDVLQRAPAKEGAPIAILGAGTGLGEAFMTTGLNGDYEVWPSEGGHAEFAPRGDGSSKLEFEMLQYLQIKYSAKARVSVERVVSGRGLGNIYEFLAWKYPEKVNKDIHRKFIGPVEGPRTFDPAAITAAAIGGECELCTQTVNMWCGAYGSEAGVAVLKYMPFGGLFVTGGVTAKLRDFILGRKGGNTNHFMEAFMDKGRVTPMLMRVPVYVVKGEDLGERGAMLKAARLFMEFRKQRKMSTGQM